MSNWRGRRGGAKGRARNRRSTLTAPARDESSQDETADGPLAKVIDLFKTAKRPE